MRKLKCVECGKKYRDCISDDAKNVTCPECSMKLNKIEMSMGALIEAVNGRTLKEWRTSYNITIKHLADYLGVQQKLIKKLESRERPTSIDKFNIYYGILDRYWKSDDGYEISKAHKKKLAKNWVEYGGGLGK